MKIYISVDMEGIPGTFNWEHEKIDRPNVRRYMMDHVEYTIDEILKTRLQLIWKKSVLPILTIVEIIYYMI